MFQLESFEEHRQNLKKYLEQNKALKSLRTNVSRARSGSAKSIKLKQEFTEMSENTKDSDQRLLTDLTTLFESRHDILASPFRYVLSSSVPSKFELFHHNVTTGTFKRYRSNS